MNQRILLLADISSPHTQKWAVAFAQKGFHIGLFSLNTCDTNWYDAYENIRVLHKGEPAPTSSLLGKLRYLRALPKLKRCIREFHPVLVHAHYATSYGLLGALSKSVPLIVSAWGSDVYEFPRKSFLHKAILKFNLRAADKIFSTSYVMKGELWKYSHKEIEVIPFGVETDVFYPYIPATKTKNTIHIGTIKAMEDIYGIRHIIEAVELVKQKLPDVAIKVFLVGSGSKLNQYKTLVANKHLDDTIVFTGKVPHGEIAGYHNLLDILLNVSTVDESFGVSVIEAMACEKAVIVTDAPGLKEVVGEHGIVIEKQNTPQLANAIMQLINLKELRIQLGKTARQHVMANYDFKNCFLQMEKAYISLISLHMTLEHAAF